VGTRITRTALPVIAVLSLTGSPMEMAVLASLSYGPGVLVGLLAGGWVDRSRKREILVGADLVRALAVATVPLAAWLGRLEVVQVYVVAVVVGGATALFQIADVALLPRLVPPERLVEGNAKLAATESVAEVTGPALAGVLIQALGAPLAVLLDAASYVWSALFLRSLRHQEKPGGGGEGTSVLRDLAVGARATLGHPVVGLLVAATGTTMFCAGAFAALYMLYALRTLGLQASTVGVIIGVGGVGALGGTALARALPSRLGLGPTLVSSLLVYQVAGLLIPLAGLPSVPRALAPWLLVAHQLVGDAFFMVFFVLATSLRQTLLPRELLGRGNATLQIVTGSLLPLGALAAGSVAGSLGLRETLLAGALLGLTGPALLAASKAVRTAIEPR